MPKLQYVGGSFGVATWHGPVTRKSYRAGLSKPIIEVLEEDVELALEKWTEQNGLNRKKVFSRYVQPRRTRIAPNIVGKDILAVTNDVDDTIELDEAFFQTVVDDVCESSAIDATAGAIELAEDHGIELSDIYDGENRITKRDVERHIQDNPGDSSYIPNF